MKPIHSLSSAILGLLISSGTAHAEVANFSFDATVTSTDGSLSGVNVGTSFSGSFSYDSDATATNSDPYINFSVGSWLNYLGQVGQISANIGGHVISADSLDAHLFLLPSSSYYLELLATPLAVDGTLYPSGGFGLGFATNMTEPLPSGLPTSFDIAKFDAGAIGYLDVNTTTVGEFRSVLFTINSVKAVPEPSTYAMLLAGMSALGFAIRRKKSAA